MLLRVQLLAVFSSLLAAACSATDRPTSIVGPATVIFYGDSAVITAPDTVDRATPFLARIRTFGGGCTRLVARTDVAIKGMLAEIRPYNVTDFDNGTTCPANLMFLEHTATIQFATPGVGVLRVIGAQYTAGEPNPAPAGIRERRIVVR
jgi:hypothetical protein